MINLKTKRILVPYDFSETAENAVAHAAFLASFTKGEVMLLHVQKKNEMLNIFMPALKLKKPNVITDFIYEKLNTDAEKFAKKFGVKVTPVLSLGNITNEIISIAEESKANLIVMGTQGDDSTNGVFLGSNTYRTLTKSDLPILTVRTGTSKKGYSNILLPIDLSQHTRQKVNVAIQLANLFGAHIHVLGLYGSNEEGNKFKLEVYYKQIEKLCLKAKVNVDCTYVKTDSKVEKTLSHAKKVGADIIISMTDQKAEFKSMILGNYIHQLIDTSKIPVLCLKPELSEIEYGSTAGSPY